MDKIKNELIEAFKSKNIDVINYNDRISVITEFCNYNVYSVTRTMTGSVEENKYRYLCMKLLKDVYKQIEEDMHCEDVWEYNVSMEYMINGLVPYLFKRMDNLNKSCVYGLLKDSKVELLEEIVRIKGLSDEGFEENSVRELKDMQ